MFLLPVPAREWRTPSQAQPKDCFGRENRTRFRVRARLNDGHVIWCGWFDDRADFDRFLWSIATGELWRDRYVQRLPRPWWPGLDPLIGYDFATVVFLTSPTGSNQTSWTVPSDWNSSNNLIEVLGAGASGGAIQNASNRHATGGGAGAYSSVANLSLSIGATPTFQIGTGGTAIVAGAASNGNAGGDTWFNNTALIGSSVGAKGGSGGAGAGGGNQSGGAGGAAASGTGTTKNDGGRGGNLTGASGNGASGGGGAAGPAGAGGNGVDSSAITANVTTAGGSANNGATAGGAAGNNNGSSGTEWTTKGCGSGGGGNSAASTLTAGSGALYGGGGGGADLLSASGTATSGAGIQGLIVITYTPLLVPFSINDLSPPRRDFITADRSFSSGFNPNLAGAPPSPPPPRAPDDLPVAFPRMPQSWAASYNLNLIGQDVLPVLQMDWPIPTPPFRAPQSWTQASPFWIVKPFLQTDWPLPTPPVRMPQSWVNPTMFWTIMPFAQSDWPLPIPPFRAPQSWAASYNLNLIGQDKLPAGSVSMALAPVGFPPTSWPRTWIASYNLNLIGQDVIAVRQQDWPLPVPNVRMPQSWLDGPPFWAVKPFAQNDWPLPTPPYRLPQSWAQVLPFWAVKPFAQVDWPLPTPPFRAPQSWAASYNLNLIGQDVLPSGKPAYELPPMPSYPTSLRTWAVSAGVLLVPPPYPPFLQFDWPVPTPRPRLPQSWASGYNLNLIGQDRLPPFRAPDPLPGRWGSPERSFIAFAAPGYFPIVLPISQTDWPLPTPPVRMPQGWAASYNLNLIGQDILPAGRPLYALPPVGFPPTSWPRTWIASYNLNLIGQDALPVRQGDWPLPITNPPARQSWTQSTPLYLVALRPFSQSDWPLPMSPVRMPQSWTQSSPFWAVKPFLQSEWPLPTSNVFPTSLRGISTRLPHPLAFNLVPTAQRDWPLPVARPRMPQSWASGYNLNLIGKDTIAFRQQYWPLPGRHPPPQFSYSASILLPLILGNPPYRSRTVVTAPSSQTTIRGGRRSTTVVTATFPSRTRLLP